MSDDDIIIESFDEFEKKFGARRERENRERGLNALNALNTQPSYPNPLGEDAFWGLAGRMVRTIDPHTEADPAAVLIQFLVAVGNALGRGPHMRVGRSRHGVNLYAVIAGPTGKGRKGMGMDDVRAVCVPAADDWAARITSGLSSGEGLIHAIRDTVTVKGKVEDQGVVDKRLLVVEGEFARTLRVAAREGNILSTTLRDAWDSITLRNMTKTNPATATEPHVSVIGHVTRDDLHKHLSETDMLNGYGNRFLWVAARRSKYLPFGGDLPDEALDSIVDDLRHVLLTQRDEHSISWGSAKDLWASIYPDLSEGKTGLLGAMTARAEAQVLRLAMLYAVLDCSRRIETVHLKAALAVWKYCEDSARWIFGGKSGDVVVDTLIAELRVRPEGMTRNEIYDLFSRHVPRSRIEQALEGIQEQGAAIMEPEKTGGRPAERWFYACAKSAKSPYPCEKKRKSRPASADTRGPVEDKGATFGGGEIDADGENDCWVFDIEDAARIMSQIHPSKRAFIRYSDGTCVATLVNGRATATFRANPRGRQ